MIKILCDVCKKELTTEVVGKLAFTERATALAFINHKKQNQEGLIQKTYDLCPDCLKKVKEALKI